jgi:ABC-type dipeptide/oligopeptide/nickel transport system permease component
MALHNRYLPLWLHRVCNGIFGITISATVACLGLSRFPPGHWLYRLSFILLWLSIPIGILLAMIAQRFSIVEGVAGDFGYDEMEDNDKSKDKS